MANGTCTSKDVKNSFSNFTNFYSDLIRKRSDKYLTLSESLTSDDDLVFVDFGTCDGGNILPLFQQLAERVWSLDKNKEVTFVFNDQLSNDFNNTVQKIKDCDMLQDQRAHFLLSVGNVYTRCLHKRSINVGFCLFVLQWLSVKCEIRNGLFWTDCTEKEESIMHTKSDEDYRDFLSCRAAELKTGGVLILFIPYGFAFYDVCTDVFREMLEEKLISEEEFSQTNVPVYTNRNASELKRISEIFGQEFGLDVVEISTEEIEIAENLLGNNVTFAEYIKSWMFTSVFHGLNPSRDNQEKIDLCNLFFNRLQQRIHVKTNKTKKIWLTDLIEIILKKADK